MLCRRSDVLPCARPRRQQGLLRARGLRGSAAQSQGPRGAARATQAQAGMDRPGTMGSPINGGFNGKIHYKWPFSIAMFVYQRVTHVAMLVDKKDHRRIDIGLCIASFLIPFNDHGIELRDHKNIDPFDP